MEVVDLSHPWSMHTPMWPGYASPKIYYTRNLATHKIVAQEIVTALHAGTHLDGVMHGADSMFDMAALRLDKIITRVSSSMFRTSCRIGTSSNPSTSPER